VRYFDGAGVAARRRMRDRDDPNDNVVLVSLRGDDNDAGPVFNAFLLAAGGFPMP